MHEHTLISAVDISAQASPAVLLELVAMESR